MLSSLPPVCVFLLRLQSAEELHVRTLSASPGLNLAPMIARVSCMEQRGRWTSVRETLPSSTRRRVHSDSSSRVRAGSLSSVNKKPSQPTHSGDEERARQDEEIGQQVRDARSITIGATFAIATVGGSRNSRIPDQ